MGSLSGLELVLYGIISFGASILGGIAGGGGAFITTPLLIFMGLSPAQAVATGKFGGLAVAAGSLSGMRTHKIASKKIIVIVMAMAVVIGLIAPQIITRLDGQVYRKLLGFILLAMIPVVWFKRVGRAQHAPSLPKTIAGYAAIGFALFLLSIFSGGVGVLINLVLMGMLGMSAIEANITKRYSTLILNLVVLIGVLFSGLLYVPVMIIQLFTTTVGGYIGGRLAVSRGNRFVMSIFMFFMLVAALELLLG